MNTTFESHLQEAEVTVRRRPEIGDKLLKDTMCKEKRIKFVEREASRCFLIIMSKVTIPNENS